MDIELNELKGKLENHEKRIQKLESLLEKNVPKIEKKDSIKEFIISKNPKDYVQKTLVIGYYLEKYLNMDYFNSNDILKGFKDAKEKAPSKKKIYDKISPNIKKGYLMEAGELKGNKKAWMLTNSGERYVENNLQE